MLHIKYDPKKATVTIVSDRNGTVSLKNASVEKEGEALRIKGNREFTFYAWDEIREESILMKIKDECKKSKKVGIFKRRIIQYVPHRTFYEYKETEPFELLTTSFAMEIE